MPPKHKVVIAATAEGDLADIHAFIARNNPANAEKFIAFLTDQAQTLEESPLRCPLIPENKLLGTDYRHLLFGDYRVLFRVEPAQVVILRIIHGSRLIEGGVEF